MGKGLAWGSRSWEAKRQRKRVGRHVRPEGWLLFHDLINSRHLFQICVFPLRDSNPRWAGKKRNQIQISHYCATLTHVCASKPTRDRTRCTCVSVSLRQNADFCPFFRKSDIEDILSTLCISCFYPWIPGVLMAPRYLSAALTLLLNSNLISFQLPDWQLTSSCHSFKISLPIIPSTDYSSYCPLGHLGHCHPPRPSGLRSQHHFSFLHFCSLGQTLKIVGYFLKNTLWVLVPF